MNKFSHLPSEKCDRKNQSRRMNTLQTCTFIPRAAVRQRCVDSTKSPESLLFGVPVNTLIANANTKSLDAASPLVAQNCTSILFTAAVNIVSSPIQNFRYFSFVKRTERFHDKKITRLLRMKMRAPSTHENDKLYLPDSAFWLWSAQKCTYIQNYFKIPSYPAFVQTSFASPVHLRMEERQWIME